MHTAATDRPPRPLYAGLRWCALWLLCATLAACGTTLRLEQDVSSFPNWTNATGQPQAGQHFELQRLPSQPPQDPVWRTLSSSLTRQMAHWGLTPTPSAGDRSAEWLVELRYQSDRVARNPYPHPHWGLSASRGGFESGLGLWFSGTLDLTPPYYQRQLTISMRSAHSGQVAFESSARHDGPWPDSPVMWDALLDAALDGFPLPPGGNRQVVREVARDPSSPSTQP